MTQRKKRHMGLGVALWCLFSAISIASITILLLVSNVFSKQEYLEQSRRLLSRIGSEAMRIISREGAAADVGSLVYSGGGSGAYLIYEEDRSSVVYAGQAMSDSALGRIFEWGWENASMDQPAFWVHGDELSCVYLLTADGRDCCLYLTFSLVPFHTFEGGARIVALVSALTAAAFSLVISAALADFVTRPVAEVTAKARELSGGGGGVKKDYFFTEIDTLSGALDSAREELSKSEHIQRELIANVSHDFKTPLTMIKAYASMIKEISGENKEKRDANAQVIIDEADRLAALVSDVLELSRLQSGAAEGKREVFNFSEEVYAILGRFEYLGDTQGYIFELCIEDGLYIRADRMQIGQVIYNLVGNAVNYTGEDKRVRVKLEKRENSARLEVIDSGKGIPKDEVNTIFDRYYRSSGTHKRPVQGTGLGLSIVKNILLQHNFAFGVVSEAGKGSCFWAEFPLAEEKSI